MEGFITFAAAAVVIGGVLYGLKKLFDLIEKKPGETKRGTKGGPRLP